MNRCLAAVLSLAALMLFPGMASAKWVKFETGRDESGRIRDITYVNPDSVQRKGNLVRVTILTDFVKPHSLMTGGAKSKSWVWVKDYDCRKRLHRYAKVAHFPANMAQGTPRLDKDADPDFPKMTKWTKVDSEVDDSDLPLFKYACAAATQPNPQSSASPKPGAAPSGKYAIDKRGGGNLYTTKASIDVLAEPKAGSKKLATYESGAIMVVIGKATGTDFLYVSPCKACDSGFVNRSEFMSKTKR